MVRLRGELEKERSGLEKDSEFQTASKALGAASEERKTKLESERSPFPEEKTRF